VEEPQFALFGILAKMFGLFPGYNLGLLIGHLLAAATFYLVARASSCTVSWAFVSALAFGLAPYLFAQSPHHITCQYAWHVPLFLLVWRWCATDSGLTLASPHLKAALAIAVITGVQNPYYTNVFCQLTLLGGAIVAWRMRSWAPLTGALAVIAAAACAFAMMNIDTWTYRAAHTANPGALLREYKWLDIYGFKLVDLFIPPVAHRGQSFAAFGLAHRQASPLLDEGAAYLGLIGIAALLWLVATAVRNAVEQRTSAVPLEAWQVLWIVIMFNTGGLNAIVGSFTGFTMFRTACRYSIVILAIVLLYAARRLSDWQRTATEHTPPDMLQIVTRTAVAGLCLLTLWDQVPRAPTPDERALIARQVQADREFVGTMEAALPSGAMVFQLPVMDFPEAPLPGVPSYDHFRPYLYSKDLRYSFGAIKGRERDRWQREVQELLVRGATVDQQAQKIRFDVENVRRAVDKVKELGFSALYVNRNGFPDRGKGLEEALLEIGYDAPPIRNATGDLACVILDRKTRSPDRDSDAAQ